MFKFKKNKGTEGDDSKYSPDKKQALEGIEQNEDKKEKGEKWYKKIIDNSKGKDKSIKEFDEKGKKESSDIDSSIGKEKKKFLFKKDKNSNLEEQLKEAVKSITVLSSKIVHYESEIQKLEKELKEEKKINRNESYENDLKDKEDFLNKKNYMLNEKESLLNEKEMDIHIREKKIDDKENYLFKIEERIEEEEKIYIEKVQEREQIEMVIKDVKKQLDKLQNEIKNKKEQLDSLRQKIENKENDLSEIEEYLFKKNEEIRAIKEKINEKEKRNQELEKKLLANSEKIELLDNRASEKGNYFEKKYHMLEEEKNVLLEKLNAIKNREKKIKEREEGFLAMENELIDLKDGILKSNDQIRMYKTEIKNLTNNLEQKEKEISEIKNNYKTEINILKHEIEEKKNKIESLRSNRRLKMQNAKTEQEGSKKELRGEQSVDILQEQLEDKENELNQLKETFKTEMLTLNKELETRQNEFVELKDAYIKETQQLNEEIENNKKLLEQLKEQHEKKINELGTDLQKKEEELTQLKTKMGKQVSELKAVSDEKRTGLAKMMLEKESEIFMLENEISKKEGEMELLQKTHMDEVQNMKEHMSSKQELIPKDSPDMLAIEVIGEKRTENGKEEHGREKEEKKKKTEIDIEKIEEKDMYVSKAQLIEKENEYNKMKENYENTIKTMNEELVLKNQVYEELKDALSKSNDKEKMLENNIKELKELIAEKEKNVKKRNKEIELLKSICAKFDIKYEEHNEDPLILEKIYYYLEIKEENIRILEQRIEALNENIQQKNAYFNENVNDRKQEIEYSFINFSQNNENNRNENALLISNLERRAEHPINALSSNTSKIKKKEKEKGVEELMDENSIASEGNSEGDNKHDEDIKKKLEKLKDKYKEIKAKYKTEKEEKKKIEEESQQKCQVLNKELENMKKHIEELQKNDRHHQGMSNIMNTLSPWQVSDSKKDPKNDLEEKNVDKKKNNNMDVIKGSLIAIVEDHSSGNSEHASEGNIAMKKKKGKKKKIGECEIKCDHEYHLFSGVAEVGYNVGSNNENICIFLKKEIEKLKSEKEELLSQIKHLTHKNEEVSMKGTNLKSENKELLQLNKNEIENYQNKIKQNEDIIMKLKEELEKWKKEMQENEKYTEELKNKICEQTSELMQLRNIKNEMFGKGNIRNVDDKTQQEQIEDNDTKIKLLKEEIEMLKEENKNLQNTIETLKAQFLEKEQNYLNKINESEKALENAGKNTYLTNTDKEKETEKIREEESEKKQQLLNEIKMWKNKYEQLKTKYDELDKHKLGTINAEMENSAKSGSGYSIFVTSNSIQEDPSMKGDKEGQKITYISTEKTHTFYDNKLSSKDSSSKSSNDNDGANITIKKVQKEAKHLKDEINRLSLLYSNEVNEKNNYEIKTKNLENQLKMLQAKEKEHTDIIANLSKKIEHMKIRNDKLKVTINEKSNEINEKESEINEMFCLLKDRDKHIKKNESNAKKGGHESQHNLQSHKMKHKASLRNSGSFHREDTQWLKESNSIIREKDRDKYIKNGHQDGVRYEHEQYSKHCIMKDSYKDKYKYLKKKTEAEDANRNNEVDYKKKTHANASHESKYTRTNAGGHNYSKNHSGRGSSSESFFIRKNNCRVMKIVQENKHMHTDKVVGVYIYSQNMKRFNNLDIENVSMENIEKLYSSYDNEYNTPDVLAVICFMLEEIVKLLFLTEQCIQLYENININKWQLLYIPDDIRLFLLKYFSFFNKIRNFLKKYKREYDNEDYDSSWFAFQNYLKNSSVPKKEAVDFFGSQYMKENNIKGSGSVYTTATANNNSTVTATNVATNATTNAAAATNGTSIDANKKNTNKSEFEDNKISKRNGITDILNFSKDEIRLKTISQLRKELSFEKKAKIILHRDYQMLLYNYEETAKKLRKIKHTIKKLRNMEVYKENKKLILDLEKQFSMSENSDELYSFSQSKAKNKNKNIIIDNEKDISENEEETPPFIIPANVSTAAEIIRSQANKKGYLTASACILNKQIASSSSRTPSKTVTRHINTPVHTLAPVTLSRKLIKPGLQDLSQLQPLPYTLTQPGSNMRNVKSNNNVGSNVSSVTTTDKLKTSNALLQNMNVNFSKIENGQFALENSRENNYSDRKKEKEVIDRNSSKFYPLTNENYRAEPNDANVYDESKRENNFHYVHRSPFD